METGSRQHLSPIVNWQVILPSLLISPLYTHSKAVFCSPAGPQHISHWQQPPPPPLHHHCLHHHPFHLGPCGPKIRIFYGQTSSTDKWPSLPQWVQYFDVRQVLHEWGIGVQYGYCELWREVFAWTVHLDSISGLQTVVVVVALSWPPYKLQSGTGMMVRVIHQHHQAHNWSNSSSSYLLAGIPFDTHHHHHRHSYHRSIRWPGSRSVAHLPTSLRRKVSSIMRWLDCPSSTTTTTTTFDVAETIQDTSSNRHRSSPSFTFALFTDSTAHLL